MHQLSESLEDMLATVKGRPITVADKAELLMLLSEAASLAKRYEDAPVAEVKWDWLSETLVEGTVRRERPNASLEDFLSIPDGQRVRIVLDKEGV